MILVPLSLLAFSIHGVIEHIINPDYRCLRIIIALPACKVRCMFMSVLSEFFNVCKQQQFWSSLFISH